MTGDIDNNREMEQKTDMEEGMQKIGRASCRERVSHIV